MTANRFYLPATNLQRGLTIELPEAMGRQVARVLRMRENDHLVIFDGSGKEWPGQIASIHRDTVSVSLDEPSDPGSESALQVTICQALIPAERMEFVIQKCTELGAARIIPVITDRVQSRDQAISQNKRNRWERIAIEAAEQSGRTRVPEILSTELLSDCLARATAEGTVIMLWEEERGKNLKEAVRESLRRGSGHVSVLIGPVGGLSEDEAEAGRSAGAVMAGAGPRILRAETASMVALAALMYEADELA